MSPIANIVPDFDFSSMHTTWPATVFAVATGATTTLVPHFNEGSIEANTPPADVSAEYT